MAITPLPTPPSRNDPTNFATRADAFMAALPAFATETNATAVEVDNDRIASAASATNAQTQVGLAAAQVALAATQVGLASAQRVLAETAASAASATANVTQWVSGTTYTAGANVWSPINYQTYRRISTGAGTTDPSADAVNWQAITSGLTANDLSGGVQGSLPYQAATGDTAMLAPSTAGYFLTTNGAGANPAWVAPPAGGPNGITTTTPMTANITLTSSSNQVQVVAPTSDGLSIILPDPTTITTPSSPRFIIKNQSSVLTQGASAFPYHLSVRRSDGSLVTVINAGGEAAISLVNNSTARGDWSVIGKNLSLIRVAATTTQTDNGSLPPVKLDNGGYVVAFAGNIYYINKFGNVVTYSATGNVFGIEKISSTTLLITSYWSTQTTIYTYYVTVSDTDLTFATSQNKALATGITNGISLVKLSATNYIIAFGKTGFVAAIGMTLSSGTLTYGTQNDFVVADTPILTAQSLVPITSTTALLAYGVGSASYTLFGQVLTLSGTTISAGTALSLATDTNSFNYNYCFQQNGSIVVLYRLAATTGAVACTISGTTITKGTSVAVFNSPSNNPLRQWNFGSTGNSLYNSFNNSNNSQYFVFHVSGTTITTRYASNTATVVQSVGVMRDTINNKIFGLNQIATYISGQGMASGGLDVLVRQLNETTSVVSTALNESGDSSGPIGISAYNVAVASAGGVVYANTSSNRVFSLMNTCSFDANWSGSYGLTYNRYARAFTLAANELTPNNNHHIENGWTIMRGNGSAFAFVEMAT